MDKLIETPGIASLSKSQVSVMAKELDTAVDAFRSRGLGNIREKSSAKELPQIVAHYVR